MVYHIVSAGSFIISHTLLINLCRSWPSNSKVEVENSTLTSSLGQNSSLFAKSNQVEKHINYGNSLKTLHCGVPHGLLLGPLAFLNLNWLFFISLCQWCTSWFGFGPSSILLTTIWYLSDFPDSNGCLVIILLSSGQRRTNVQFGLYQKFQVPRIRMVSR